jgi:hypothetical protein
VGSLGVAPVRNITKTAAIQNDNKTIIRLLLNINKVFTAPNDIIFLPSFHFETEPINHYFI